MQQEAVEVCTCSWIDVSVDLVNIISSHSGDEQIHNREGILHLKSELGTTVALTCDARTSRSTSRRRHVLRDATEDLWSDDV